MYSFDIFGRDVAGFGGENLYHILHAILNTFKIRTRSANSMELLIHFIEFLRSQSVGERRIRNMSIPRVECVTS